MRGGSALAGAPSASLMENDYGLDIAEIIRTIDSTEVVTFRFLILGQRLLVDMRTNEIDGPLLKIVPRVSSAEERFRSLKQMRPRFRVPEKITSIWWPRYVGSLEECGIWHALTQRVVESGFPAVVGEARSVFKELCKLEREEIHKSITGEGYETLWTSRN